MSGYSQSQFMVIAGAVWSSSFIIIALAKGQYLPSLETIKWTFIIGVLSACANYLLIYSMRKMEASFATTIYRLNLAFAAIIAFIFLNEPVNLLKIFSLLLASLSVFCFAHHQQKSIIKEGWEMLFVILIASLLRAVYGISYKFAMAGDIQFLWFLSGPGLGWVALGSMTVFNGGNLIIPFSTVLRGVISGFLLCGLVFFFARAIEYGQASIIIPVSQMSFVVTAILAWM